MKRGEEINMQSEFERLSRNGFEKPKLDKMSLHFVIPLVLFYVVVGTLLICLEHLVTEVASWVVAGGLVVYGGWLLLRYFRSDIRQRTMGIDLAVGLIFALAGILLVCSPYDMKDVFPKVWALSLIFGGFLKVQYAFDEKSVNVKRWWMMLIFAAISLTIGILALMNRAVFGDGQHLAIGIFMLGEAALDLVTYFLITNGVKRQQGGIQINAGSAAPAKTAAPETGNTAE